MGYGIAATDRWLSDAGLCAGGQVRYAGFAGDIVVDGEPHAAENKAFFPSVAAAVDYRLYLGGVPLSSRAGPRWSAIGLDDFINPGLA